jgi:hypothetical protein
MILKIILITALINLVLWKPTYIIIKDFENERIHALRVPLYVALRLCIHDKEHCRIISSRIYYKIMEMAQKEKEEGLT